MTIENIGDIFFVNGCVHKTKLGDFPFLKEGKVRDIYEVGDEHLLIVATDRLSAFDIVMTQPVPNKGRMLTAISTFWFNKTKSIIANHMTNIDPQGFFSSQSTYKKIKEQIVVVQKVKPLKYEAVVRGYLVGTAWSDYLKSSSVSGVWLKEGLNKFDKLDKPIFTPSTKAALGDHDQNINYEEMIKTLGSELTKEIRDKSLELYNEAFDYSISKGMILADTKFEFGLDNCGNLVLIDEIFTPDSSRFWDQLTYQKGSEPLSFDKQFIRDYLNANSWDRKEAIQLPNEVIDQTSERYRLALEKLIGDD